MATVQPRKYLTRQRVKAEEEEAVKPLRSTTSRVRRANADTEEVVATAPKPRGRPRKALVETNGNERVVEAKTTKSAKSSLKTTTTSTTTAQAKRTRFVKATAKKVAFDEKLSADINKETHCPSEDELVALTPKKPKNARVVGKEATRLAGTKKRLFDNNNAVESVTSTLPNAPSTRSTHTSRRSAITSALGGSRAKRSLINKTFAVPAVRPPKSTESAFGNDENTDPHFSALHSPPKRRQISEPKDLEKKLPDVVQIESPSPKPLRQLESNAAMSPRKPGSTSLSEKLEQTKLGPQTATSPTKPLSIFRVSSPVKGNSTPSVARSKLLATPARRPPVEALFAAIDKEDAPSKVFTASINSPAKRPPGLESAAKRQPVDAAKFPASVQSIALIETHVGLKNLGSPVRKPEAMASVRKTIGPSPLRQPPMRSIKLDFHVKTIHEDTEEISVKADDEDDAAKTVTNKLSHMMVSPSGKSQLPRPSKPTSPFDVRSVSYATLGPASHDANPPTARKLFDASISNMKPSFNLFSEELDDEEEAFLIAASAKDTSEVPELSLSNKLRRPSISTQASVEPLSSRISEIKFEKPKFDDYGSPMDIDVDEMEIDENVAPSAFDIPIDPLLLAQEVTMCQSSTGVKVVALKPPSDESPTRAGSYTPGNPNQRSYKPLSQNLSTPQRLAPPRNPYFKTPLSTPLRERSCKKASPGPLNGAVIFVDVHTAEGADAGSSFVDSLNTLGARIVKSWNWIAPKESGGVGLPDLDKIGITHVVFKDGSPRTLQRVKDTGGFVLCVGVGWAIECERENRWVEEELYSVDLDFVPRGGHRRRKSMEPRALPLPSFNTPASNENLIPPSTPRVQYVLPQAPKTICAAPMPPSTPLPSKIGMISFAGAQTCPPKEREMDWDMDTNPLLLQNLALARRKSLQFKPKFASPLSRKVINAEEFY